MNDTSYDAWLASLKAGDEVVLSGRWKTEIRKIDKITPTRQIKIGGYVFKGGYHRGGNAWDNGYRIKEVTQSIKDDLKKNNLSRELENFKFSKLTLQQLEQIVAIIDLCIGSTESAQAKPEAEGE